MKAIAEDPVSFFEDGGWSFLEPESDDGSDDDDEDSEDDEFRVSKTLAVSVILNKIDYIICYNVIISWQVSESEGSDADESEEDYSSEVSEESYSEEELDSDESSGKDWSDLEREAAEDDEGRDSDNQNNRRSMKKSRSSKHGSVQAYGHTVSYAYIENEQTLFAGPRLAKSITAATEERNTLTSESARAAARVSTSRPRRPGDRKP